MTTTQISKISEKIKMLQERKKNAESEMKEKLKKQNTRKAYQIGNFVAKEMNINLAEIDMKTFKIKFKEFAKGAANSES
jgi:predicted phage-related endonuclease